MRRWSSTGTLFLDHTISRPDNDVMLECVSHVIHHILQTSKTDKYIELFDERQHPLGSFELVEDVDVDDIYNFLQLICHNHQIETDVAIMACGYIDRLINYTSSSFTFFNWRRILLAAILIADKVSEENQVWNVDFLRSLPDLSLGDLNTLERTFLFLIKFDLVISPSLYANYYFGLRSIFGLQIVPESPLTKKQSIDLSFNELPLFHKKNAEILAEKSAQKEEFVKLKFLGLSRHKSEGFTEGSHTVGLKEFLNQRKSFV
uniref:Cyclin-like domain-containing protein n=1 Tax=Arcella intermedia TaxID=1963864 RepID=A0A6B2LFB4_9EUKA